MDKKLFYTSYLIFVIIFFFSVFASQKLLVNKFYTSHDGEGHVIRLIEFDRALVDGQFPVRIAKRINYGLGYPFFNFNYPLAYYSGEVIHLLGFSFVDSFKILMFMSVFCGGIFIYLFTNKYFGRVGGIASGLFYVIAPYRFLNMYVRGDVAESIGLSLIPLLLWSTDNIFYKKKYSCFYLTLSFSILILSHNITAMIGIALSIFLLIFKLIWSEGKITLIRGYIFSLLTSLFLTAFFWFPAVYESGLTKLAELTEDYIKFFPTLLEIIYSPWGFGAYKQGIFSGKMSPQIGIIHELVFVISLIILIRQLIINRLIKEKDRLLLFFAIVSFSSIFLSLGYSEILWDNIYFLKLVQIPWRFVGYTTLGFAVSAGYLMSQIKKRPVKILLLIVFLVFLLYSNRNHIRINQFIDFDNPFLTDQVYGPSTTSKDEHMPKAAPRIYQIPNQNGDVIPFDSGSSKRIVWKSNYHKFEVSLNNAGDFRDNISYFPGWTAKVDGVDVKINYQTDEFKRLRISIPSGKHRVEFFFGETSYRKIADMISLSTIPFLLIIVFLNLLGSKRLKFKF